ncbi:hypothetical protein EON63_24935 [archaeon]|nr:MAG: hypothetical protein EON63_24935 [archaeon]
MASAVGALSDLSLASNEQLAAIIDKSIVSNPWTETTGTTFQDKLFEIVGMMRSKGFQPITADEYRAGLRKASGPVSLWSPLAPGKGELTLQIPLDDAQKTVEGAASLEQTISSAEAASTLCLDMSEEEGQVDTQADTVEWVTLQY